MSYYSVVIEPNNNSCLPHYSHSGTLCPKCGVSVILKVENQLHLTSAVLDLYYGSVYRPAWPIGRGDKMAQIWLEKMYTLKIKFNDRESLLCHLHNSNNYQSNIDVQLCVGSTVEFSCNQLCRIFLNGNFIY